MHTIATLKKIIDALIIDSCIREDAYQLLADRIGIEKNALRHCEATAVPIPLFGQIESELALLLEGKPLHRILGYRYFWKDRFKLSDDTLEPRPDTEILIEACLKYRTDTQAKYKILDLGTGSGCILLSLLREYTCAVGMGVDISLGSLYTAEINADNLRLADRCRWVQSDWLDNIVGCYDIIVSNPPYIPTRDIKKLSATVQNYDPLKALDGGEDGLGVYRKFSQELPGVMHSDTLVILELGYDQPNLVSKLFEDNGYKVIDILKDYGGNPRCIALKR